jgi:hypothetical protein
VNTSRLRRIIGRLLVHRYDRTAVTSGSVDPENNETDTTSMTMTSQPCLYQLQDRLIVSSGGAGTVNTPTLYVSPDDPLAVGDQVSNILTIKGTPLLVDPQVVETIDTLALSDAGIVRMATLRGTTVRRVD